MPGFYIASYPNNPYRYEIGFIDLRTLLNNEPEINVHLYVENNLAEAETIIKDIINFFKEFHDIESVPGKILLSIPFDTIKSKILSITTTTRDRSSFFSWFY